MKRQLTKIEDLGDNLEEALVLDIKYSTIGLAQQWDQLHQLGTRMQHNLEQQIQAKYCGPVTRAGQGVGGTGCQEPSEPQGLEFGVLFIKELLRR